MPLSSEDELAILRLLSKYAQTGSRQEADAWVDLFVEEAVWERKKGASTGKYTEQVRIEGRRALREFALRSFAMQGGVVHQYVAANPVIWGEGDRAQGSSTAFILGIEPKGVSVILIGNFEDQYRKTEQGWKFAYRGISLAT